MKQEINLYHPFELPLPNTAYITWRQFWIGNAVMLCVFILVYFMLLWQVHSLNKQKELLLGQNQQLKQQFYANKSKYPDLFFTQDIHDTLQKMEKTLAAQSRFFSAIARPTPFSAGLMELARIDIANVWLTSIYISNIDKKTVLQGNGYSANDIQSYLSKLSQSPMFANSELTVNDIQNVSKDNTLSFEITVASKS